MASAAPAMPSPAQRRPRTRKSIAHVPAQDSEGDSENHDPLSLSQGSSGKQGAASKKSRSKSLGPGGLDALQETSGNRRRSSVLAVPKSILKPTIPLSPLREIPIRKPQTQDNAPASPTRAPAHSAQSYDQLLEAAIAAEESHTGVKAPQEQQVDAAEAERQAAEEKVAEERKRRKAEIQKQRDARRKSMANRRVSFAPEATLHTWDTEIMQESTTSTGSDESTRRASNMTKTQDGGSRPTTPPEQAEDANNIPSPERQREAHQKRRRRSSGAPTPNFDDPEAPASSPGSIGSASEDATSDSHHSEAGDDDGDGTLGDATMQSLEEFGGSSPLRQEGIDEDLDTSLEDAAKRAGTKTIKYDENGDVSLEIVGNEVTGAGKPWLKRGSVAASPHPGRRTSLESSRDQENVNPFSPTSKQISGTNGSPTRSSVGDEDMSMDMTNVVGGILNKDPTQSGKDKSTRKSTGRRQSVAFRRQSINGLGESTMDFTTAFGGIRGQNDGDAVDEDENLSMEFTSIFGGIQNKPGKAAAPAPASPGSPEHTNVLDADGDMEMTEAFGSIHPSATEHPESPVGQGQTMDLTTAMGSIKQSATPGHQAPEPVEPAEQTEQGMAAFATSGLRRTPVTRPPPPVRSTSATGSPSVSSPAQRGSAGKRQTPDKRPETPFDQLTPQPANPTTPSKTPPSSQVSMRKTSPKMLFRNEIKNAASPSATSTPSLFNKTQVNGQHTPKIVLSAPKSEANRRSTRSRPGSPDLAARLDRRASIGEQAQEFEPDTRTRGVRFDDPREMAEEVSRQRDEDARRESKQFALEQEADQASGDATATLKELMSNMTPKKTKLHGRKSLAVGSARGLLGKRPAELDNDASDDESSPQTFGSAASPVKKIRLQGPQSASKVGAKARPVTPMSTSSSSPGRQASTPKSSGKFKNADALPEAQRSPPVLGQTAPIDAEKEPNDDGDARIGLQDFLNLTNVRFMELTTTKRRPTIAPASQQALEGDESNQEDPRQYFQDCVAASACTLPMLELFQHSCRELKKYISEGRSIIREIEAETLEENPPIFREYMSASPAERAAIDNQFKHMKTNARLLSKGTWYEWRMKLLEGIKESLRDTARGFEQDSKILLQKEDALEPIFTAVMQEHAALEREASQLVQRGEELAACDPEDLEAARERLHEVNASIADKKKAIEAHKAALAQAEQETASLAQAKHAAQAETKEAQRVRESCRGWSMGEVRAIQSRVDALCASSGWNVAAASGSSLTLVYKGQLELSFDTAAYGTSASASSASSTGLSLSYVGSSTASSIAWNDAAGPDQPSTTGRFFLQLLRAELHALPPSSTSASTLLKLVSAGWTAAQRVEAAAQQLRLRVGITRASIVGDARLALAADVLLPGVKSLVNVAFEVRPAIEFTSGADVSVAVGARASVVYGEEYREDKMSEFVAKRVGGELREGREAEWADAVVALREGLVRRGAKS